MKRVALSILFMIATAVGALLPGPSRATGLIAGATEPTQIMNNIQLVMSYVEQVQQTIHQYEMVLQGIKNLKTQFTGQALLSQMRRLFVDYRVQESFQNLRTLYIQGQRIAYAQSEFENLFRRQYPEYGTNLNYRDFRTEYGDWSRTTKEMMVEAIQLSGLQEEAFNSESSMMEEVANASNSSQGITQAVQAGNMAAISVASQLQKLRQLQMAQLRAQNAYLMGEQAKDERTEQVVDRLFEGFTWNEFGRAE